MAQETLDGTKVEAFVGKAVSDAGGLAAVLFASIGDRLGLFKDLATGGPATSSELAKRTNTNERYIREWLGGMTAAGYLEYEPKTEKFSLPPEHVPVLAQEGGPMFFGAGYQMFPDLIGNFEQVIRAFREGGGVAQSAFPERFYEAMARDTAIGFENSLLQIWIPSVPEVEAKLRNGIDVADVGCGSGRALIKMAQSFPQSRFVGYDNFAPVIDKAVVAAKEAGVSDRIRFEERDISKGLPEKYDLITTFDVIHDAVDPRGLLRIIRESLEPDGTYLCLDINSSDKLEENVGPLGTLLHSFSVFYCMTTSLANGGEGLGTLGLHEKKVRELGGEAGFKSIRKLPIEDPFHNLYQLKG